MRIIELNRKQIKHFLKHLEKHNELNTSEKRRKFFEKDKEPFIEFVNLFIVKTDGLKNELLKVIFRWSEKYFIVRVYRTRYKKEVLFKELYYTFKE